MQTVLITGASSGIGKAAAERLLADGYIVYVAARRVEKMSALAALGGRPIAMDITRDEDIQAAVERIVREAGGIDILVNNAGFAAYGAMEDTDLDDARYQFEVNLFGLARLTQLALPHMRAQGAGTIVNVSSMGGRIYTLLGSWYHATKHALEGWSDCLRLELAPFGIRVIIVEPGAIDTEFGGVLTGPLLERSGDTVYAGPARKVAEATRRLSGVGNATPPAVIADVIAKAVKARRPRTRYVAGKLARPLLTLRKWAGDRVYDRVVMAAT